MAAHRCNYEREIGEMIQKMKNIDKVLMGNGTKGLLGKMDLVTTEIIPDINTTLEKLRGYSHIKNWILGGLVAFLFGVCMFLLGLQPAMAGP